MSPQVEETGKARHISRRFSASQAPRPPARRSQELHPEWESELSPPLTNFP